MWEGYRTPWSLNSGGAKDGLYRSNDDGNTWKRLEGNGMPEGPLGRIGVGVSGADSNVVYALIEAKKGGLYRSDDGGDHWSYVTDDHRFRQRAWYFTHVWADPKNSNTVYIANTGLYRSVDSGKTWERLNAPHGDHHGLWVDPQNTQRMINGNDGGATISVDGGKNWTTLLNQPTAQFYHVAADNDFLYGIYGSQQDNTSIGIRTRSDRGYIDRPEWDAVGGGESGYVVPDPRDSNIIYADDEGPIFTRYDRRINQAQSIQEWPMMLDGHPAIEEKYRYTWTMPIVISSHNPDVIYHSAQVVFRSSDQGRTWTTISPDLTRNDKSKQQDSGGPLTKDQYTVEYYDVIFTLAESPKQDGVLWAGTDDGLIHVTRDGGKNWANVTPKEMPEWGMVSIIEASPFDVATAYAAVDVHKLDNFHPYIFKTTDFGKTWSKISGGLPDNSYVHVVREDPARKGLLYAGTETAVWVSFDDGSHWQLLQNNLPVTPIHDLIIHGKDLVAATHGRSYWVLDDLSPLRQLTPPISAEDAHLFAPAAAVRTRTGHTSRRRYAIGENPPDGAILYYSLKEKPKDSAKLELLDAQGKVIRAFNSEKKKTEDSPEEWEHDEDVEHIPADAGLNRFAWDLRYETPTKIPASIYSNGRPIGPLVLPGHYQVRLTVAGKSSTAPLEVTLDPRVKTSGRRPAQAIRTDAQAARPPGRNEQSHSGHSRPANPAPGPRAAPRLARRRQNRGIQFQRPAQENQRHRRGIDPGECESHRRRSQLPHQAQQQIRLSGPGRGQRRHRPYRRRIGSARGTRPATRSPASKVARCPFERRPRPKRSHAEKQHPANRPCRREGKLIVECGSPTAALTIDTIPPADCSLATK